MTASRVGVALVGAGYWGPNLFRNFMTSDRIDLRWVCDIDRERAAKLVGRYSAVRVTGNIEDVLNDAGVEAVALATPATTHGPLGMACLEAGKHLLVEKPLASSVVEGERMVDAAARRGQVLMCDHTYCYTSTVRKLRELVDNDVLGEIQYVDSVRINLGLVQSDIDVFWDLAPHDLSILDYVLGDRFTPVAVGAHGADPIGAGKACVGYLAMPLAGNAIAHLHVNWLSPTKIRAMVVGGSKLVAVWDDLNPSQRLSMFDRGVETSRFAEGNPSDAALREQLMISYRVGEMVAPALREAEALQGVVTEFASAIREGRPAATDGEAGLHVLRLLEAASSSLGQDGALVPVRERAVVGGAAAGGRTWS
jgi:predicted dehydrogenase